MIMEDVEVKVYDGKTRYEIKEDVKDMISKRWFPYLMSGNMDNGLIILYIKI